MNPYVNAITGRLSLRSPQRRALEILDRVVEIVPPDKNINLLHALETIHSEFPSVTDFEREFPSLCFALATGVGKTRLMGAFVSYLHLAHGLNNFFILAPNLTIYRKLIADFTPNTPKYVFKGISEFAVEPPVIVTGENYIQGVGIRKDSLPGLSSSVVINIFNISKINSEVRGGNTPRIKALQEVLGESYFEYLSELPDLVLLMDEAHRYRASAGVRAINELKPVLGLELTATPFVEGSRGAAPFKNVIQDYPLRRAMEDGFVKEPAVVTRKNFSPVGMSADGIERMKLEDGVRLHEGVKVELDTYARESGSPFVKPFVLVIARDTTHASQLVHLIKSEEFFEGRYEDKVLQVDSSKSGAEEDEMVEGLLQVEQTDNPIEIVVHVNMLKEGWDVTNLYTIIPLRAANARILIEQSIGRGLRLPYGKRTGVTAVDRLNIVAHDKFQDIVDEASRPDSVIQMAQVILDPEQLQQKTITVVAAPQLANRIGLAAAQTSPNTQIAAGSQPSAFSIPEEQKIALDAYTAIRKMESQPGKVPNSASLNTPQVQEEVLKEVISSYRPAEQEEDSHFELPDFAAIVAKTTALVIEQTIDIPRIYEVPTEEVQGRFLPFLLDLSALSYPAPTEELWAQHLRTKQREIISLSKAGIERSRLEDYVVIGLVDFSDICYDDHADLLYDLAGQTVQHFRNYLSDADTGKVLRLHQQEITRNIHAQMQKHYTEEEVEYKVHISKGFTELQPCAYTASAEEPILDYRQSPKDKSNMSRYLFGRFQRCLYPVQKFQADQERILAVILEREASKWFKPAKGQFQIFYKMGADYPEYQPDFVAETKDCIYMLEPKMKKEMEASDVLAKKEAAERWCRNASNHAKSQGGKPWQYLLIPHDKIAENMTLAGLAAQFGSSAS